MNPNKALWEKGDFTRIAATMRESGEALVSALGVKSGLKIFWMLDAATARQPCRQLNLVVTFSEWISPATSLRPGIGGRRSWVLRTSGFRKVMPLISPGCPTGRSILWLVSSRHVCPEAIRRRQGDGTRDPSWRSSCHGEPIPNDPTLVAQILRSVPPIHRHRRRASSVQ